MVAPTTVILDRAGAITGKPSNVGSGQFVEAGIGSLNKLTRSQKVKARHDYVLKRQANRKVNLGDRGNVTFNRAGGLFWKYSPGACQPSNFSLQGTRLSQPGIAGLLSPEEGRQICRAPISFYEQDFPARENDYRIFIDGVEVTAYVRGALSWTIETTGGMNTCTFELNNNQDAFIITPLNICSNLSPKGWRLDSPSYAARPIHSEPRYDELAKYLLYRTKFKRVGPGSSKAEIDPETGMWLYPLNPFECIINVHDPVRIFRKLPHVGGARVQNRGKVAYYDLWIACYTGFVNTVTWDDEYVEGDRSVSLSCYDYRGIMERQRVRTHGIPIKGGNVDQFRKKDDFIDKVLAYKGNRGEPPEVIAQQAQDHNLTQNLKALYELLKQNQLLNCKVTTDTSPTSQTTQCYNRGLVTANSQVATLAAQARQLEAIFYQKSQIIKKLNGETATLIVTDTEVRFDYKPAQSTAATDIATKQRADLINSTGRQGPGPTTQDSSNNLLEGDAIGSFISNTPQTGAAPAGTGGVAMLVNGKTTIQGIISVDIQYLSQSAWYQGGSKKSNVGRVTPTIRATGDLEILQAMDTYLQTSPPMRAPLIPPSGYNPYGETTDEQAKLNAEVVDTNVINTAITTALTTETVSYITGDGVRARSSVQGQATRTGFQAVTAANKAAWRTAIQEAIQKVNAKINTIKKELAGVVDKLKALIKAIKDQITAQQKKQEDLLKKNNLSAANALDKLTELTRLYDEARRQGTAKLDPRAKAAGNLAEVLLNEPTFEKRHTVLFADLVRAVDKDEHPLAGMCYEEAAVWLCCANSKVLPGTLMELSGYGSTDLQEWNKTVIFGVIGRPLTYNEVTYAGRLSTADLNSTLSPFRPLLHMLLPKSGTGARTIVQQDITANTGNSTSFQYATRKSLLDEISVLLNYQVFTNGWGDLVFEFPHYNAAPPDFGRIFQGAYTLEKELKGVSFTPETSDINTAWVLEGNEPEKKPDGDRGLAITNLLYKVSITAPILARRFGVKVENIKIDIPGVGAQIGAAQAPPGGVESLIAYGLLYIQRQIGEAYRVSIKDFPDRPYLLPNRPIWIVPRQKICLSKTVSYTLDKPNGDATVRIDTGFTRWMFRDGTFRTILGGEGGVIDYAGVLTGAVKYTMKEGVLNTQPANVDATGKRKQQRSLSPVSCDPRLKAAYLRSGDFLSREIAGQEDQYVHHSANTVGFGTGGGFTPPISVFGFGKYGAQLFRQSTNPGNKKDSFTNTAASGLRVEQEKKNKTKEVYKVTNLFLNPYPFGEGHGRGSLYEAWGNMRYNDRGQFANTKISYKGNIEMPWHPGVDISWAAGTDIHTPIALRDLSLVLDVGPGPSDYPNRTGYVEYAIRIANTYIATPNGALAFQFATDQKNPKYKEVTAGGRKIRQILVYKGLFDLWMKFAGKAGKIKIKRGRGTGGFLLSGFGEVTLPGATSQNGFAGKTITCKLSFAHCQEIMGENRGNKFYFYGAGINSCNAGTVVAKIGSVGTGTPHLHASLALYPSKWKSMKVSTDEDAFKEAVKANNEYITTQLLLRFTGGNPQSNQLSPAWQRAFKGSRLKITTVREAVEYALRNNTRVQYYIETKEGRATETNPFFFFKPEEFIPQVGKVAQEKKYPAYYSSQGYFDSIGVGPKTAAPICGGVSKDDETRIKTEYTKCMLAAQSLASQSYLASSRATYKCQQKATTESTQLAAKSRKNRKTDQQGNPKVKAVAEGNMRRRPKAKGKKDSPTRA